MINKVITSLKRKFRLGHSTKNLIYLIKLSFYPKTAIVCCISVTVIFDIFLGGWMSCVRVNTTTYNVLFALVTGVTASCFISIVIELSNNYKNNKLACYELDDYYELILDFERSKYVSNKLMNEDEEHEVHDIVQLVWQELPKIVPLLVTTLEHKKAFLTDSEIKILQSLKYEYDSIRFEVYSKINRKLQYNSLNHPDDGYLRYKYPDNVIYDLPEWLNKYLATKESEAAIQKLTDTVMSDEYLLKQCMSDYDISFCNINRYNNECEQDDTKVMQEEIEISEELTDDYIDMTEEEYKIWCDDINKNIEKEETPFVSFYISQSCFKIAQHIGKLKKIVSQKPYVGIYLKIMASANKKG